MTAPARVAILGAGEIGAGWAALFARFGARVRVLDPDPAAGERLTRELRCAAVVNAAPAAAPGTITMAASLEDALAGAEWVQESVPERLGLKRDLIGRAGALLERGAILASSSSSFTPRELFAGLAASERMLIAHPLHPVYAVPVVELSLSPGAPVSLAERAGAALRSVDREPVLVRGELRGLVANRLTAALLREAIDLVARGAVSARELDQIISRGIALGWAAEGALGTEARGAGAAGLDGFLDTMSEPLAAIWGSLAGWEELGAHRREALLGAAPELRASGAAGARAGADPCAWAKEIAALLERA